MIRTTFVFSLLLIVSLSSVAAPPVEDPGRQYSAIERMDLERLQAAHEDAQAYQESRRSIPPAPGLTDYRAIFHAHAEDADHTGGTLEEMLRDAKKMDVDAIFLSDHFRPPRDFIDDRWRGLKDGVLFVPGSETHGFLIHPETSMMDYMDKSKEEIIERVTRGKGLIFLSHVEDRVEHSMKGLTGMEVYNRHADAKDDTGMLLQLIGRMTNPKTLGPIKQAVEQYPEEVLATQVDYPEQYFEKWDEASQEQRVAGVAANDCHHNQVFLLKMVDANSVRVGTIVDDDEDMRILTAEQYPGIRELTKGHEPGDVLVQVDFDPYWASFHNVSTHVLAPELSEDALREAVLEGHAYVSHDWMCDPTGFQYLARKKAGERAGIMGDEVTLENGLTLEAAFPVACHVRVIRNGGVHAETESAATFSTIVDSPGVYRVEGWLTIDGESRPWIYSNPIYVRAQ